MDYLAQWEEFLTTRYAASTVRAYLYELRHLAAATDPLRAKAENIISYVSKQRHQRTASTVARTLCALRCFYDWAKYSKLVSSSPMVGLKAPRAGKHLPRALSEADVQRLLQAAHPQRATLIILLMVYGGLRLVEVTRLMCEDIDLGEKTVRVCGKGGKERLVPLHPDLQKALDRWMISKCPGEPLFRGYKNSGLKRRAIGMIIEQAGQRAGLSRRLSPHMLRHTFATRLLRSGANLRVVQELLGHASVATTQIYTDLVQADLVHAVAAL